MSIALKMKNCKAVTIGLSLSSKVSYGCGDASRNVVWGAMSAWLMYYYTNVAHVSALSWGAMSAWLMYYYTNVAHVSALSIGTIMLLSRIIDGFTDIIMKIETWEGATMAIAYGYSVCYCYGSHVLSS